MAHAGKSAHWLFPHQHLKLLGFSLLPVSGVWGGTLLYLILESLIYGWCTCNINSRVDPLAIGLREIKVVLTKKLPPSWLALIVLAGAVQVMGNKNHQILVQLWTPVVIGMPRYASGCSSGMNGTYRVTTCFLKSYYKFLCAVDGSWCRNSKLVQMKRE